MFQLKTKRLQLIPLAAEQLILLQKDRHLMEKSMGLHLSEMLVSDSMQEEINEVLPLWLKFTQKHPEDYAWGTTWEIVLREENKSIGSIGLSGLPDKNGRVVVGYVIDANYHRKGYATEALGALKKWIFASPHTRKVSAYTPIENLASQKVLQKNGFQNVGEVIEDGMDCYIWETDKLI